MAGRTAILSVRIISDAKSDGFRKAARDVAKFEAKVKKSLTGSMKSMAALGTKAAAATVGVAGMAPAIAAVSTAAYQALAPMAALTAAMAPAALTSAALGVATIKTALSGMGDALKAADPQAFNEAIADMPPSMQAGARALRDLKEGFSAIGDTVKQNFWEPLSNLPQLASLIEPIGAAMARLATDMGTAAAGVVDFISQGTGLAATSQLIDSSATAMGSLARAAASTVEGIIAVGAAAAPFFESLTANIEQAAAAWRDKMVAGFADGSLQQYFTDAVDKARAFADVMGQIGGIISGVWSAMNAAGQPMLGMLAGLVEQTNNWVNSAAGMATLEQYFTAMASAVAALAPVLGQVVEIIVGTLSPAIAGLVETLAPAASLLVEAFAGVIQAVVPLVEPLGQIVALIGETLAGAIQAILPIIQQLAEIFTNGLNAAFTALQPIMPVIVDAFAQLATGIEPLLPSIQNLVESFVNLIPPIAEAASRILPALVEVLIAIMPAIEGVIDGVAGFLDSIAPLIEVLTPLIENGLKLLATVLGWVAEKIQPVIEFAVSLGLGLGSLFGFAGKASGALNKLKGVLGSIKGFFEKVTGAVGGLISKIADLIGKIASIRFPSPPAWISKFFSEPMSMNAPDVEHIGFGRFAAADPIGFLGSRSPSAGPSVAPVTVNVNITGALLSDEIAIAEAVTHALNRRAKVMGTSTAVGV